MLEANRGFSTFNKSTLFAANTYAAYYALQCDCFDYFVMLMPRAPYRTRLRRDYDFDAPPLGAR